MWRNVSVTEFVRNFADLINRVSYRGERLRLMRGRKVVAEVRPVATPGKLGDLVELLDSLPRMSPPDATSLAEDVAAAREELNRQPAQDRWASL
jgi:hypothetical protein